MEGQGNRQGWVGANAEHRLGYARVWVRSETEEAFFLQSFHSSRASSKHSPASLCSATTASLSTDAPFTPSSPSLKSLPSSSAKALLLPCGVAGKCKVLGSILRLEVELQLELDTSVSVCAPVGRAPFGATRTSCVSTQKPVSLSADEDCGRQDYC